MKDRCIHGHLLCEQTTRARLRLHRPNGRWYVMRNCRVCESIAVSIRWYVGKHTTRGTYKYKGKYQPTMDEIVRRVERRWEKRVGIKIVN